MTEKTIEQRLEDIEREVRRTAVMVESFAAVFGGSLFPMLRRGVDLKKQKLVVEYQLEASKRVAEGGRVTPEEFAAKVRELLPEHADERELPGILASWMFKDEECRPLYFHLRDAGLPNLDRWAEEDEARRNAELKRINA